MKAVRLRVLLLAPWAAAIAGSAFLAGVSPPAAQMIDPEIEERLLAEAAVGSGRWEEGVIRCSRVLRQPTLPDSSRISYYGYLARAQAGLGRIEEALATLKELESRYAESDIRLPQGWRVRDMAGLHACMGAANILKRAQRYEEAADAYRRKEGYVLAMVEDPLYPLAQSFAEKALRRDADRLEAAVRVADCLLAAGKAGEAEGLFRDAQDIATRHADDPTSPTWLLDWKYYGAVYVNKRLGDCLKDKAYYRKALAAHPGLTTSTLANKRDIWEMADCIDRAQLEALAK